MKTSQGSDMDADLLIIVVKDVQALTRYVLPTGSDKEAATLIYFNNRDLHELHHTCVGAYSRENRNGGEKMRTWKKGK